MNDLILHNVTDMASAFALKRVLCVYVMAKSNYIFYRYNNNLVTSFAEHMYGHFPFRGCHSCPPLL